MKYEYRKKKDAEERVSHALKQTKERLGIGPARPLRGAKPSPLVSDSWQREANPAPTSDRIPDAAPASDFMHAHESKRGIRETEATVKEIRRKASKIVPAFNKGALQYMPDDNSD
jgi:hypothetical protein